MARALRRIPLAGRVVALIALANAIAWGLIVPPFNVPDEPAHLFYAQYLGETGKLPRPSPRANWYADDVNAVLVVARLYDVVGEPANRPPWGEPAERAFDAAERPGLDRVGVGDAASATTNPPLYYLVQAGLYRVAHGAGVTDRLALMRLLSALMAALTTLCIFLFVRELLPGSPLAWTVGALAAGLQPMFAFISSGVNNDAGLYLVSAALFLAVARLLRRGLTVRRAVAVAVVLALGVLVKTQMLAFAPGVALALLVAAWRARGEQSPWRPLLAAAGAGAAPLAVYGILGATVWSRPIFDRVGEVSSGSGVQRPWQVKEQLSYLLQLYAPRLPNLTDLVPGVPLYDQWVKGLVGNFGWLDYGFPAWVYPVAGGIWALVALLALVALGRRWAAVRAHAAELTVFAVMGAGLAAAVAVAGYRFYVDSGSPFLQARYLLPLLPLYALFPAMAVRAFGDRAAPFLALGLVGGVLAHGVFAQLLTLGRFYG